MDSFFEKVYRVVEQIPKGKVATYGQVALLCGNPKMSKFVGFALHSNPYSGVGEVLNERKSKSDSDFKAGLSKRKSKKSKPRVVPCHRVVNRFGEVSSSFAFGGKDVQKMMLQAEGIKFNNNGRVNLDEYLWKPNNQENSDKY